MPDEITTTTNPAPDVAEGYVEAKPAEPIVETVPTDPTPAPEPTPLRQAQGEPPTQEPSVPAPIDSTPAEMPPASAPSSGQENSEVPNLGGQAVDLNTAHTTPQTPSTSSGPASAESFGEAKQATPEQAPEPISMSEAELLTAEIAQRKLLKPSNRFMRWLKAKSVAARKLRAQKKSDKIMALFNQHEKVTNELVRKNLHFPKQTAGNHLELLEKEGKIKQVGTDGPKVFYVKL